MNSILSASSWNPLNLFSTRDDSMLENKRNHTEHALPTIQSKFKNKSDEVINKKISLEQETLNNLAYLVPSSLSKLNLYDIRDSIIGLAGLNVLALGGYASISAAQMLIHTIKNNSGLPDSQEKYKGDLIAGGGIVLTLGVINICAGMVMSTFLITPSLKASTELKNRISTINSNFSDLKNLNLREVKLQAGKNDFNSLLVANSGFLDLDVINIIGQEVFDKSIKDSQ
ncbi:MAG: hypothetical protein H0U49_12900 [Parachlamydiaceae bacterium]|nr:hypothetical protein [Parachlamydiaceae bacterium]